MKKAKKKKWLAFLLTAALVVALSGSLVFATEDGKDASGSPQAEVIETIAAQVGEGSEMDTTGSVESGGVEQDLTAEEDPDTTEDVDPNSGTDKDTDAALDGDLNSTPEGDAEAGEDPNAEQDAAAGESQDGDSEEEPSQVPDGTSEDALSESGEEDPDAVTGSVSEEDLSVEGAIEDLDEDEDDEIALLDVEEASTYEEFRTAIANAAEGDTVTLTEDITADVSNGSCFTVSQSGITVDLGYHTITATGEGGSANYKLFSITCDGSFTLKNGTLDGGTGEGNEKTASAKCVAVSASGPDHVTLEGLTIQYFASSGEAVLFGNGTHVIKNCIIQNNETRGIYARDSQSVTIESSTISGNTSSGHGGGIYFYLGKELYITDSTISGNTASGDGGGIYYDGNYSNTGYIFSIDNSIISGNMTKGSGRGGGGVSVFYADSVSVTNNIISDNKTDDGSYSYGGGVCITDCVGTICFAGNTVTNNFGYGLGGGICITNPTFDPDSIEIRNNVISENTVDSDKYYSYGGGLCINIFQSGSNPDSTAVCTLSGNTITDNKALSEIGRGGGISLYNASEHGKFIIESGVIANNSANWGGGINYALKQNAVLYLTNALITGNTAVRGGGVWECPTADTEMYPTFGGAVFGNTATGTFTYNDVLTNASGDDIRFEGDDTDMALTQERTGTASVAQRALGGMAVDWYSDEADARSSELVDVTADYQNRTAAFGLHAELNEKGQELAKADAALYIYNNTAEQVGGGIASNGPVVFGDGTEKTVKAVKVWLDQSGNTIETGLPVSEVEVTLIRVDSNGNKVDLETVSLNEANNWTHLFTDLPTNYTYETREETVVNGYTPEYTVETDENGNETITIINTYREYFDIDEEIVVEEENRETWVKSESVNEYNAIEFEMSTYLPVITTHDIENGNFTMNFHEVLDSDLNLDEADASFTVTIAGYRIDHQYYTISIGEDTEDDCSFHVDVDLSALYRDGVISEEDLQGDTEIMIYFYADLEGTGLNGSYTSTVWYEIFENEELVYTSSIDVVTVYTYEVVLYKYDATTLADGDYDSTVKLADAVFGIYEDDACEAAVSRYGEDYTVTSDETGTAIFYGLAEGTYYVKELEAPEGYDVSDEIVEVVLGSDLEGYEYEIWFADTPTGVEVIPPKKQEENDFTEKKTKEKEKEIDEKENEIEGSIGEDVEESAAAPKTDDDSGMVKWLILAACALVMLAAAAELVFKKERGRK